MKLRLSDFVIIRGLIFISFFRPNVCFFEYFNKNIKDFTPGYALEQTTSKYTLCQNRKVNWKVRKLEIYKHNHNNDPLKQIIYQTKWEYWIILKTLHAVFSIKLSEQWSRKINLNFIVHVIWIQKKKYSIFVSPVRLVVTLQLNKIRNPIEKIKKKQYNRNDRQISQPRPSFMPVSISARILRQSRRNLIH